MVSKNAKSKLVILETKLKERLIIYIENIFTYLSKRVKALTF